MYNEKNGDCPPAIKAVNQWYGRDDIPIGVWGGGFANVEDSPWCAYVRTIQENPSKHYGLDKYPNWFSDKLNSEFSSAVIARNNGSITKYATQMSMDVYKDVISKVPDGSVTIVSIGYPEDLYTLLHYDDSATNLWKSKVGNMYLMGGGYNLDSGNSHGFREDGINLYKDWGKKPIITTCEGGEDYMRTGLNQDMVTAITSGHFTKFKSASPVKRGYFYHCGMRYASQFCHTNNNPSGQLKGRLSWDSFTILLAAHDIGAVNIQGIETRPDGGDLGCFPAGFNERVFYLAHMTNGNYVLSYMQSLINYEPLIAQKVKENYICQHMHNNVVPAVYVACENKLVYIIHGHRFASADLRCVSHSKDTVISSADPRVAFSNLFL
eukprot:gene23475-28421_t